MPIDIITSTDTIPGKTWEYVRFACSNRTVGVSAVKDFFAKIADFTGSAVSGYKKVIDKAINEVCSELTGMAEQAGGDAIVGLRIEVLPVSSKGTAMIMVMVYGTVVKFTPVK